jgi:hypothetical protein
MDSSASFRIEECLSFAWNAWKRDAGTYLVVTLLLAIANGIASIVTSAIHLPLPGFGHFILNMLLSGLFAGAFMAVADRGAAGQTPSIDDAWKPLRERQGDYLIVGLAMSVGLIFTFALFMFAPLLVVRGEGYEAALRKSADLALGRLSDVVVLAVVILLLNAAGCVACFVGLFVTMPLSALVIARAYALLTGTATPTATPSLPGAQP